MSKPMQADSFYTNPRLTALFILFIVVLGGVAFAGLARQEDPSMAERYAAGEYLLTRRLCSTGRVLNQRTAGDKPQRNSRNQKKFFLPQSPVYPSSPLNY